MSSSLFLALVFSFVSTVVFAGPFAQVMKEPSNLEINSDTFDLRPSDVYYLGSHDRELRESEITKSLAERRYKLARSVDFTPSTYSYIFYRIDNKTDSKQTVVINFPVKSQKNLFWQVQGDQLVRLEPMASARLFLSFELAPGPATIVMAHYLDGYFNALPSNLKFQDFSTQMRELTSSQHFVGGVFGALIIMVFLHLGMLIFFRRVDFLYHAIYSLAMMLIFGCVLSYIPFNMRLVSCLILVAEVALVYFFHSTLSMRQKEPFFYRLSQLMLVYIFGSTLVAMVYPSWAVMGSTVPVVSMFCFFVSAKRAIRGHRPAVFLVIGGVAFFFTLNLAAVMFIVNGQHQMTQIALIGFAIENSCFALTISQKFRVSEQAALREIEHAFSQLKKVFYPHQIDQIKSGVDLEKTMPTGQNEAAVICFDIVDSSKIKQAIAKEFIENSIKRCISVINQNYDATKLTANGYRIKEMGDGFLCSVGYPFASPTGHSKAQAAVELALEFIRVFQLEAKDLDNPKPVYCALGIALDELEGRFPEVGAIEYDVFGRAITLATRYEAMRRQLFPSGVDGHIVILQNRVYEALPASLMELFVSVDLKESQISVRDDGGAERLYFYLVKADLRQLRKAG